MIASAWSVALVRDWNVEGTEALSAVAVAPQLNACDRTRLVTSFATNGHAVGNGHVVGRRCGEEREDGQRLAGG
jgi:hypothetical protein